MSASLELNSNLSVRLYACHRLLLAVEVGQNELFETVLRILSWSLRAHASVTYTMFKPATKILGATVIFVNYPSIVVTAYGLLLQVPYISEMYDILKGSKPLSEASSFGRLGNTWHHYEKVIHCLWHRI